MTSTINSWGNYHLGSYYEDFDRMWEERARNKIRAADALLIDEISMLDGHTFDCLECMISIIRSYGDRNEGSDNPYLKDKLAEIKAAAHTKETLSDTMLRLRWDTTRGIGHIRPFGGMQLIAVGDFYQLSPVPNGIDVLMESDNLKEIDYDLKVGRQGAYAFESVAWHKLGLQTIELKNVEFVLLPCSAKLTYLFPGLLPYLLGELLSSLRCVQQIICLRNTTLYLERNNICLGRKNLYLGRSICL